ncbi:hypothetical protein ACH3XW_23995 [Acanthocheilonema viteae]|uniref:SXP/RAL-2 family protein Ani s 5-like cation-binding domain-containing protein n=1 Tax=Acanthocheilonema viteae TaxID=6277 RepID=A0A498SAZ3_ACAVI|nr:unnamed protein product [Acanthocheilonema viteae]
MKAFVIASLLISCAFAQQQQQQPQLQQQQQFPVPPFLIGASPKVISEFQQLINSGRQRTDREMEQAVESWIAQQSQKIQVSFQKFKQQALNALQQAEAQHQASAAKLSPEARRVDAQLSSIAKSVSLTPMQKQEQIDMIISKLPENVKQELQRAIQG